jgi:hypothetical protein
MNVEPGAGRELTQNDRARLATWTAASLTG